MASFALLPLLVFAGLSGVSAQAADSNPFEQKSVNKTDASNKLSIGDSAPDFSVRDIQNRPLSLSQFRGHKPVYLIFWTTWCPPCLKKVPGLIKAQQDIGEQLQIIAVNTSWNDSRAALRQFENNHSEVHNSGVNYTIIWDDAAAISKAYGVWGTPTEFIIDRAGKITHLDNIPADLHSLIQNQPEPSL